MAPGVTGQAALDLGRPPIAEPPLLVEVSFAAPGRYVEFERPVSDTRSRCASFIADPLRLEGDRRSGTTVTDLPRVA